MGGQLELVLLKHNHPPSSLWEKLWLKQEFIFDLIKNDDFQKKILMLKQNVFSLALITLAAFMFREYSPQSTPGSQGIVNV